VACCIGSDGSTIEASFCMARFLEFLVNHWVLTGLWLAVATTLLAYLNSKLSAGSLSPNQTVALVNKDEGIVLDVRDRKEFEKGHIVDAVNIPLPKLAERAGELEKSKERPIIVVCQHGQQAGTAVNLLQGKGFTKVSKMAGGLSEWQTQNLPLVR
jgi:rhodanese-related sulfurtransferase